MQALVESLRTMWQDNFTLPKHGKTKYGWGTFALWWLWSVAGVVPGALAAAYVFGRWQFTDERL